MSAYCMFDLSVYYLFLQYFDTVGWVLRPVKTVARIRNLYCVGEMLNHAQSINQAPLIQYFLLHNPLIVKQQIVKICSPALIQ